MQNISANEVKTRGLEAALAGSKEAVVTVRGKNAYVVLDIERYNEMREHELAQALVEARADLAAGNYKIQSVAEHMADIKAAMDDV